ncbi:MAG: hypothetical protein ACI97B_000590 [Verrucomicrobiales bacterium]|jgi:hypothetical protein
MVGYNHYAEGFSLSFILSMSCCTVKVIGMINRIVIAGFAIHSADPRMYRQDE